MLEINGNLGEAGGQIVRSSLTLSMLTQTPFRMINVRAGRKPTGLKKQHQTAVSAAARVCNACVTGNSLGSGTFTFEPNAIQSGTYRFDIGTAGSTTLIMQTLLPALMFADGTFEIEVTGGTHNPWAPTFDFLQKAYQPIVRQMGGDVRLDISRIGFYPKGGGQISANVQPAENWKPLDLVKRGKEVSRVVRPLVAKLPLHIAERECRTIETTDGWKKAKYRVEENNNSFSPGNVVTIELSFEKITEVFTALGKQGTPAQKVAKTALRAATEYLESEAVVGDYLADQLMLPMAIAADKFGHTYRYRTHAPSDHSTTHAALIGQFLDVEVDMQPQGENDYVFSIHRS